MTAMDRFTTRTIVKIIIGTTAILVYLWLTAFTPKSEDTPPPVYKVEAQVVDYQTFPKMISLYGKVSPLNPLNIDAEVSTTITDIFVENGQLVTEGNSLIQLDDSDYILQKTDLEKAIEKINNQIDANAQETKALDALIDHDAALLQNAQDLLNRYESLSAKFKSQQGLIQRQDTVNLRAKSLEQNQTNKLNLVNATKNLELSKQQTELKLLDTLEDIKNCKIMASKPGVVGNIEHEVGDYVQKGQPLATVIDPESIYIYAYLPIQYYADLTTGLRARMRNLDNTPLTLAEFDSQVKSQSAHIDGLFYFDGGSPKLPIGQIVTLALELPSDKLSFLVPEAAIYEQHYLYLIKNNILHKQEIEIVGTYYQANQVKYLITSPSINNGDTILTSHLPWPKSGQSVTYEQ